uniref:Solute carrier family 28 member 2 n=1 Tax=Sarcophilus harrisii TaxID=9305 RepID=A0A7N4NJ11_SARHA
MEKEKEKDSISLSTKQNYQDNHGLDITGEELDNLEKTKTEDTGINLGNGSELPTFQRGSQQPFSKARQFYKTHTQLFQRILLSLLCTAYAAYVLAACILNFQRALALFVLTCLGVFYLAYSLIKKHFGKELRCGKPFGNFRQRLWLKWGLMAVAMVSLILWLILDTAQRPKQLVSFAGICMFLIILFAFSKHHFAVNWRAVFWGLMLEFALGILVIRTDPGFAAFQWLGEQIQIFLNYTVAGSSFVFGDALVRDVFAFQVLPIIVFFSCVMSILYYLGLMQWLIVKIAWFLQITLGTTATETLSVAGNIFVGMIDAASLVSASVMAAPCALALSKLIYPEVEESKFKNKEGVKLSRGNQKNILEAASSGAADSIGLIANIATNLIAFLAVLAFINAALSWLGEMVDIEGLSFQVISSYVLRPIAFMMGVDWADCPMVAEMLGIKFFLNEFVAYERLSHYKNKRLSGIEEWIRGEKQWISVRAEIITTFSLCGFANLSSMGITLGGLTSMAPKRKSDFAKLVVRALLTGACVSLVNACVAGILYVPRGAEADCTSFLDTTNFTSPSYEIYVCCRQLFQSVTLNNTGQIPFSQLWTSPNSLASCCGFYNHTVCAKNSLFA